MSPWKRRTMIVAALLVGYMESIVLVESVIDRAGMNRFLNMSPSLRTTVETSIPIVYAPVIACAEASPVFDGFLRFQVGIVDVVLDPWER